MKFARNTAAVTESNQKPSKESSFAVLPRGFQDGGREPQLTDMLSNMVVMESNEQLGQWRNRTPPSREQPSPVPSNKFKKPQTFKRILSRQPNNLLSVRLRKTGFDAFKISNLGGGKRRIEFSPDESVQNNLAKNTTSQTQILERLRDDQGCLTSRQNTSVQHHDYETSLSTSMLMKEQTFGQTGMTLAKKGNHKKSRSTIQSSLYAIKPAVRQVDAAAALFKSNQYTSPVSPSGVPPHNKTTNNFLDAKRQHKTMTLLENQPFSFSARNTSVQQFKNVQQHKVEAINENQVDESITAGKGSNNLPTINQKSQAASTSRNTAVQQTSQPDNPFQFNEYMQMQSQFYEQQTQEREKKGSKRAEPLPYLSKHSSRFIEREYARKMPLPASNTIQNQKQIQTSFNNPQIVKPNLNSRQSASVPRQRPNGRGMEVIKEDRQLLRGSSKDISHAYTYSNQQQPMSVHKLLAYDQNSQMLERQSSSKASLKLLKQIAERHQQTSGLSTTSRLSAGRKSELANGINLTAYQKRMLRPSDLFEAPKPKLDSEKQRHLKQAIKLAEQQVVYSELPKSLVPPRVSSLLLHQNKSTAAIEEESESAEKRGGVTIEQSPFDDKIVSQHPSNDSESNAQQTRLGKVSAKIVSAVESTSELLELGSRANSLQTQTTNQNVPNKQRKRVEQKTITQNFLIGSGPAQRNQMSRKLLEQEAMSFRARKESTPLKQQKTIIMTSQATPTKKMTLTQNGFSLYGGRSKNARPSMTVKSSPIHMKEKSSIAPPAQEYTGAQQGLETEAQVGDLPVAKAPPARQKTKQSATMSTLSKPPELAQSQTNGQKDASLTAQGRTELLEPEQDREVKTQNQDTSAKSIKMPATVEDGDTAQGIVAPENNKMSVVNEGHTDATRMVVDNKQDGGIGTKTPIDSNEDVLDKKSDYDDDKFENEEQDQDADEPVPAHILETEKNQVDGQSKELTEFTEQAPGSKQSIQGVLKEGTAAMGDQDDAEDGNKTE